MLLAGGIACAAYGRRVGLRLFDAVLCPWCAPLGREAAPLPFMLHTLALLLLLLFASHVQIALRLCTPGGMPFVWYGLAQGSVHGRLALRYLIPYALVAGLLYAGFYPPA